ncbi:MAG TPA: O-antigen ligase family protein, partial [Herpetosiphonaceae bacterium]|nr:O-antigen ligase family protein [Herpetosiphonaceae bacterium]
MTMPLSLAPALADLRRALASPRSWLTLALLLALALWSWLDSPPPLVSANAPADALAAARGAADQRAAERSAAVAAVAPLDGPRGDFERRGVALRDLDPSGRAQAAGELAADVRLVEAAARAAAAERESLRAYDDALMARTRDLGPVAETLRSATWPIVEHLKLYPPPLGTRADWVPADAAFFAARAAVLDSGSLDEQVSAAIEVGRSTYAQRQLRDLDATYRLELDRYAEQLAARQSAADPSHSPLRLGLSLLIGLTWVGLLFCSLILLSRGEPDGAIMAGYVALASWFVAGLPLAWLGAAGIVVAIAMRPALAGMLPLAAVPLYFRPRAVGALRFPLNETLFGLIAAGLALHLALSWRAGWRPRFRRDWLARHRSLLVLLGLLAVAAALSLLAPPLVDGRVALRELRRTIIEPAIWAAICSWLLWRGDLSPRLLIWSLLVPAAWVAADGLARFVLGQGVWSTGGVPRLIGLLPSSTSLGVYLGAALAGALGLALCRSAERLPAILLALPLGAGVLLTFTRGAWIGVAAAVALVGLAQGRWRPLVAAAAAAGLAGAAFGLIRPALLARLLRVGEGTGAARREIWAAARAAVEDSPWLGLGLDQFSHVDPARYGI